MTRARSLLALGDIAAARLLLERAANARDATAAFRWHRPMIRLCSECAIREASHRPCDGARLVPQGRQLCSAAAQQRLTQFQD
jgi:hypothetical protein